MGSFKCDCKPGYMFDEPSHQCIDKNECNTQGSAIFVETIFCIPWKVSFLDEKFDIFYDL